MNITKAALEDLPKILQLQKLAYMSEAKLLNDYSIQPFTQTLPELEDEFAKTVILKLTDNKNNEIIGSVRAREENGRIFIGKLMVHPDHQDKGLGTSLLKAVEAFFTAPAASHGQMASGAGQAVTANPAFELFTSSKSEKNLHLYQKNGYREFRREKGSEDYEMVFLEHQPI